MINPCVEYTAVVFGVVYVLLAAKGNIWCWLAGIISSAIYIYINLVSNLFQDAILQTYYVFAGLYGWYLWQNNSLQADSFYVVSLSRMQHVKIIGAGILLVPILGFLFSKLGNSLSYLDSAVTVFSFIATYITAKKILESWLYFIVIDIVAAVMYYINHLELTSGLYLFYTFAAMYGYYEWRKVSQAKNKTELKV